MMSDSFEEWWEKWQKGAQQVFSNYDKTFAEESWDYQQARIEALEEALEKESAYARKQKALRIQVAIERQARIEALEEAAKTVVENSEEHFSASWLVEVEAKYMEALAALLECQR